MTVLQFPELCRPLAVRPNMPPAALRVLAPLKRESDIYKVLPYLQSLGAKVGVEVLFLHVLPAGAVELSLQADRLLAAAGAACREHGLAHQTLMVDGEVAFAILDNAESLGCDQIVVARPAGSAWRNLFVTPVVRQLESLVRDVPLVLVNFTGLAQELVR